MNYDKKLKAIKKRHAEELATFKAEFIRAYGADQVPDLPGLEPVEALIEASKLLQHVNRYALPLTSKSGYELFTVLNEAIKKADEL